jgi:hypothetical protein
VYGVTGYRLSCPAPPPYFKAWGSNPIVQGPAPLVFSAADEERAAEQLLIVDQGSDQLSVGCTYIAPSGRSVILFAAMALPNLNVNPYADFDFGCGQNMFFPGGPTGYRSYYVASPSRWAYVTFTDYYHAVQPQQLPILAKTARTLLHNVEGAASTCSLDTTVPVAVGAAWHFGIGLRSDGPSLKVVATGAGGFTSYGDPSLQGYVKLRYFHIDFPGITTTVTSGGKTYRYSLTLSKPTFFYQGISYALTAKVRVTSSDDPACPAGSTGTLAFAGSENYGLLGPPPPGHPNTFKLCGINVSGTQFGTIGSGAEGGEDG